MLKGEYFRTNISKATKLLHSAGLDFGSECNIKRTWECEYVTNGRSGSNGGCPKTTLISTNKRISHTLYKTVSEDSIMG